MVVKLLDKAGRLRFTVPCAAYVADPSDGLLLLELVGADSENRAVWSHVVKARAERSLTDTQASFHAAGAEHIVQVIPTVKYHKVEQTGRLILLHDGLTRFRFDYLLGGGDAPSPWFLPALQLRLPIPVLSHWAGTLWERALGDLIRSVSVSFGPPVVWRLNGNVSSWSAVISDLIRAGRLTAEG